MSNIYNVQTLICKLTRFIKAAVNKPSAFWFLSSGSRCKEGAAPKISSGLLLGSCCGHLMQWAFVRVEDADLSAKFRNYLELVWKMGTIPKQLLGRFQCSSMHLFATILMLAIASTF